jgi:hypothetical protein
VVGLLAAFPAYTLGKVVRFAAPPCLRDVPPKRVRSNPWPFYFFLHIIMENTTYHLCSIKVRSGEQEYVIYELRQNLTQKNYTREILKFCLETSGNKKRESTDDNFCEWAYDDRLYKNPWVRDVTKGEYEILSKYLR